MRDYVMECLGSELSRMDDYESRCPVCDVCKCRMTGVEYLYEIDSDLVCEECILDYMDQYKHPVRDYVKGER